MNVHFHNGKKRKFTFKEEAGLNHTVMNTAFHCTRWTRMSPPGVHSCDGVTGQGAEGELAFLTPQECMQVPLGAGPDFPPGRAAEDLWAQRDPDICAPSTSSASLPGQQQTERHAVGCPSLISTNAAFVRRPEPPVHVGHKGGKREQGLQCLAELLQAPLHW